jgi:hypothetical protein
MSEKALTVLILYQPEATSVAFVSEVVTHFGFVAPGFSPAQQFLHIC